MPVERRRRRRRRAFRARQRLVLALGVLVASTAALAVVVAAMTWRDLRAVRGELALARQSLEGVVADPAALGSPEVRDTTRARIDDANRIIDTARRRVSGSVGVRVTGFVPVLSRQRSGLIALLDDVGTATVAGRDLLDRLEVLQGDVQLRDGTVPFDGLRMLAGDLGVAGRRFEALARPPSGLLGPLGGARREFNDIARTSASRLLDGADALTAARSFMGDGEERRLLVAVQNNAEMRDQGMVLSYAVIRFADGRVNIERNGSVGDLELDRPITMPVSPATDQAFGAMRPTLLWQSVNATADFAWSGQAMVEMYRQATGEPVDGVIAIDVPGLAALLRVVGPVDVASIPEPITADNAARLLLHDLYEGLAPGSDQGLRRERLSETTRAVVDRFTTGAHDSVALGRNLGQAAAGGHFRLWSPAENDERVFERTGLGGGPAVSAADRTFHLAVQNRTATKLDYYVKPTVRQVIELARDGTARVRTTVVVHNHAPLGAPPSYQLGPDEFTRAPGDYLASLLLWGPAGSEQQGGLPESGLVLSQHGAYVGAGQSQEVTFDTLIPRAVRDGRFTLRLVPQPRLEPMNLELQFEGPGWDVGAPAAWTGSWDRALVFDWPVNR